MEKVIGYIWRRIVLFGEPDYMEFPYGETMSSIYATEEAAFECLKMFKERMLLDITQEELDDKLRCLELFRIKGLTEGLDQIDF